MKEETRGRRHRIKDVRVFRNERNAGMQLSTNAGIVTIFVANFPEEVIARRIRHFLPHIYKELFGYDWIQEDLKKLLVGRFVYGRAIVEEYQGALYQRLV